jgi:cellulose synthase operon protein C
VLPARVAGRTAVVAALLALASGAAAQPRGAAVRAAEEDLARGRYAEARAAFEKAARAGDRGARLGLARVLLRTGEHARAEAAARAAVPGGGPAAVEARLLLAEALLATGRVAEARRGLEELGREQPRSLAARVLLARVLARVGDAAGVDRACGSVMDDYNAGRVDKKRAADLHAVAAACALCKAHKDASETYGEALALEPRRTRARLDWGYLLLDKYNSREAAQTFGEALQQDPSHPDAHVGMARVALAEGYNVVEAEKHLQQALRHDPRHVGALATRGEIALTEEDYAGAAAAAKAALAVDPTSPEGLRLLGSVAFVTGDRAGYDAARARALAQNPRAADFFHGIAETLGRHHRYDEAITLEEEAVRLDPKDASALAALGQHYLRQGDERRGLPLLERAWSGDKFNVRTYNVLDLFEEVLAKGYGFVERGRFRLRAPQGDLPVLERAVFPLLERAATDMTARYGVALPARMQIELFAQPDHFAVRTIGLPGFGAAGVCFGRVITALSPRGRNVNWGMVLWHELAHAFAIQLSRSRVPRWFTEGLAEWETARARPEWSRHHTAAIAAAFQAGELPRVGVLNTTFTRTRSLEKILVAYHFSGMVVDFLVRHHGFSTIVRMLKLWGEGLPTETVFRRATGLDLDAISARLILDLRGRLGPYLSAYTVRYERFRDLPALERAARERPADPVVQVNLGFGLFSHGLIDRAQDQAARALQLHPGLGEAHALRGEIAMARQDAAGARAAYGAALKAGLDGYELRTRLGIAALKAHDLADAQRHLARAKQLDPDGTEPYSQLGRAYEQAGRAAEALAELEGLARLDPHNGAALRKLVSGYAAAGRNDKLLHWGARALEVDPFDATLHATYARALTALGRRTEAIAELETALRCAPQDRPALERELKLLRGK